MESLIYIAAGIPFMVVIGAVIVLSTVRYHIGPVSFTVSVLGIKLREVGFADV